MRFKFTTKYKLTKITDINSEIKGKNDNEIKQISINKLMTTIEETYFSYCWRNERRDFMFKSKLLQHPFMIHIVCNIEIKM